MTKVQLLHLFDHPFTHVFACFCVCVCVCRCFSLSLPARLPALFSVFPFVSVSWLAFQTLEEKDFEAASFITQHGGTVVLMVDCHLHLAAIERWWQQHHPRERKCIALLLLLPSSSLFFCALVVGFSSSPSSKCMHIPLL